MSHHVPVRLRRLVQRRADYRCEYCLLPEVYGFGPHEPDHIAALKHQGKTHMENLARACFECNRLKGTDVASIDIETGRVVRLFNPRPDRWQQLFRFVDGEIAPLTRIGRVTENLLQFNRPESVALRQALSEAGKYPL